MEKLKEFFRSAGILGAGGAGFPSYAKLSGGADTLLINGAECEPLLYTDLTILKEELSTVLIGAEVIARTNIKQALLVVKKHTATELGYSDGQSLSHRVRVKVVGDIYPVGDEVSLVYEATGRVIRPGSLPITKGIIVYNTETLYNLGVYVRDGKPVTEKWLTVGGCVPHPSVMRVKVGTRISDLLRHLKIEVTPDMCVLDGGPSMGKIVDPASSSVKKTTKGILILPRGIQATDYKKLNIRLAVSRAETACCQCTRCTDMCPRALLGYPLEPHKMVRTAMGAAAALPKMVISATLCCGCGICETIACSQGISPKAVIQSYKDLLKQHGMKYTADSDVEVEREREYRKLPAERWKRALGVEEYDKACGYIGTTDPGGRIEIDLSQGVGAPSIPILSDGEQCHEGEMIAKANEGLSLPIHAPANGKITVTQNKIIITR